MQNLLTSVLASAAALAAGALIGTTFAAIQHAALRRYRKREQAGNLNSGWAIVPGSMTRVAYFLAALAVLQFALPTLFANGLQWWVSGGVALGYGTALFLQMRRRLANHSNSL